MKALKFLIPLLIIAVFALTCPAEATLRGTAFGGFGSLGQGLSALTDLAALGGGPRIVYHNYLLFSSLNLEDNDRSEVLAYGWLGQGHPAAALKDAQDRTQPASRLLDLFKSKKDAFRNGSR